MTRLSAIVVRVDSIHTEIYGHLTIHFPWMRDSCCYEHQPGYLSAAPRIFRWHHEILFVEGLSRFTQISERVLEELQYLRLRSDRVCPILIFADINWCLSPNRAAAFIKFTTATCLAICAKVRTPLNSPLVGANVYFSSGMASAAAETICSAPPTFLSRICLTVRRDFGASV